MGAAVCCPWASLRSPGRPIPRASPDPRYSFTRIESACQPGLIKDRKSLAVAPRHQQGPFVSCRGAASLALGRLSHPLPPRGWAGRGAPAVGPSSVPDKNSPSKCTNK